jgi:hypothetical protein
MPLGSDRTAAPGFPPAFAGVHPGYSRRRHHLPVFGIDFHGS